MLDVSFCQHWRLTPSMSRKSCCNVCSRRLYFWDSHGQVVALPSRSVRVVFLRKHSVRLPSFVARRARKWVDLIDFTFNGEIARAVDVCWLDLGAANYSQSALFLHWYNVRRESLDVNCTRSVLRCSSQRHVLVHVSCDFIAFIHVKRRNSRINLLSNRFICASYYIIMQSCRNSHLTAPKSVFRWDYRHEARNIPLCVCVVIFKFEAVLWSLFFSVCVVVFRCQGS